mgnify:CR=1 FL=1
MKRILVIEDEPDIQEMLCAYLRDAGYSVSAASDGIQAMDSFHRESWDLILLDLMLPKIDGYGVCELIRRESDVPVIMVTSKNNEVDEVLSMSYGADDYITKPYNPTILLLRIAAVLKRMEGSQNAASYRGAEVNFSKGTIRLGEKEQVLTKNEMIIFQRLLSSKDKIVSRDEIMTDLWDNEEYVNDNALTVNISRLRTKLAELGLPDAIETRKKQGYRLI